MGDVFDFDEDAVEGLERVLGRQGGKGDSLGAVCLKSGIGVGELCRICAGRRRRIAGWGGHCGHCTIDMVGL
jgi:hypothetical protein